jgi:hypothetical protein
METYATLKVRCKMNRINIIKNRNINFLLCKEKAITEESIKSASTSEWRRRIKP